MVTSAQLGRPRRYLMVLPVPCWQLTEGRFAVESAFAEHLRLLLASYQGRFDELVLAAPAMAKSQYEQGAAGCAELTAARDHIVFVPMHAAQCGRLQFWRSLPRLLARLWRLVGEAEVVHAGGSATLWRPFEFLGWLLGWLRRRKTVFVVDIDHRNSAAMQRHAGLMSFWVSWRAQLLHNRWRNLQLWLAVRGASLVLVKGAQLAADFGRARGQVHNFLDAAHSHALLLSAAAWPTRAHDLRQRPAGSLRLVYFGRLVAYKGIDRMLLAVQRAVALGVDAELDLFGDGEQRAELQALAARLQLGARVRFAGVRPYGAEFLAEVGTADALLACPLSEDTPRSALDAQARALPVVAFATYYYRELAAAGAGVRCVPWPDVEALAQELVRLSQDRAQLVQLAQAGLAFAGRNTQEHWLARRASWLP